jgi:hypothetical protein
MSSLREYLLNDEDSMFDEFKIGIVHMDSFLFHFFILCSFRVNLCYLWFINL